MKNKWGAKMSKVRLNVNIDSDVKERASQVFSKLGLDMTTAVTIYLNQVIQKNGIPFDLTLEKTHYTADEILGPDWREGLDAVEDEWEWPIK